MDYSEFIRPELLTLIPVLYVIGEVIKRSELRNALIPWILGAVGIFAAAVYLFATDEISGARAVAAAIFTAFTQGILCAAASVYANQLYKQTKNYSDDEENEKEDE